MDFEKYRYSPQNQHLFKEKRCRKSVFDPHEAYILAQLDFILLYNFFAGFEKYWVLARNPEWLVYSFTNKCLFTAKTGQKSIFLSREAENALVLYTNI
jgi:hypothetical protein